MFLKKQFQGENPMLTPMAKIERSRKALLVEVPKVQARIREITRVFSLMALVDQQGDNIELKKLEDCITALGLLKAGGATAVEVLQSTGSDLRSKIKLMRPYLRREHRRLRKDLQVVQRNSRVLRKSVRGYVYRPGTVEA